ncbi:hypothetical protein CIP107571_02076 [Corynebacterium diphtheriae]|nr:hypothetical protein CIP107571_02076 [Corynebacterium diphtheriae]
MPFVRLCVRNPAQELAVVAALGSPWGHRATTIHDDAVMLIEGSTMGSGKVFELLVDSAFKQVRCGFHVAGHAFWRIQVGK